MIRRRMTVLEKYLTKSEVSREHLAKLAGVSESLMGHWCNGRRKVRPEQALKIAKLTLYQVTPHQLRPDIWPNPTDALPQKKAA
jgi:DNA-binding transcriptional regulator YdaS (Cro superfamily)